MSVIGSALLFIPDGRFTVFWGGKKGTKINVSFQLSVVLSLLISSLRNASCDWYFQSYTCCPEIARDKLASYEYAQRHTIPSPTKSASSESLQFCSALFLSFVSLQFFFFFFSACLLPVKSKGWYDV